MNNAPTTKTPFQWAALVATAALIWGVVWAIGSQFRDYMRVDVKQLVTELIAEHSREAASSRVQIFKDLESDAREAVNRVTQLEQKCAVVQRDIVAISGQISALENWRSNCSQKMAGVESYIGRDADDIRKIEGRMDRVEGLVSKGRRE